MRRLARIALLVIVAAGCGAGTKAVGVETARTDSSAAPARRVGRFASPFPRPVFGSTSSSARCCLARTLLSYNGRPTAEGGTVLRPDLAAELPTVSADGLTWTFRLKHGLHYAPPYEGQEIVASDVIRGVEHSVNPRRRGLLRVALPRDRGGAGVRRRQGRLDLRSRSARPYTLVVHLSKPSGDLGHRFVFPESAPIPAGCGGGSREGLPSFITQSGPYMIETEATTCSRSSEPRVGSGHRRSPAAFPDRIEFSIGGSPEEYAAKVDSGKLDLAVDVKTVAPQDQIHRYEDRPGARAPRVRDAERRRSLPDDERGGAAVRRPSRAQGGQPRRRQAGAARHRRRAGAGAIATHIAPDSLEDNVLLDYDPYPSSGARGDLEAAKAEMARSGYDANGDGVCDARACKRVRAFTRTDLSGVAGRGDGAQAARSR